MKEMTIERIKEALEQAKGGLEWYNKNHPEMKEQIKWQETIIWALEKQIPQKPKIKKVKAEVEFNFAGGEVEAYEDDMSVYLCPSCNELVGDTYNRIKTHCICGQRLDWSAIN